VKLAERSRDIGVHLALRQRPARPAYLDYPYTSEEPAFTFWDDHKHQIWAFVIASTLLYGAHAFWSMIASWPCGEERLPKIEMGRPDEL
jgi:hypothetical protein